MHKELNLYKKVQHLVNNTQNILPSENTYKKGKPTIYQCLYVIRAYNQKERFIKIGWTSYSVKKRFSSQKMMPYQFDILSERFIDYSLSCCEFEIQEHLAIFAYKPRIKFGGHTECYTMDSLSDPVLKLLIGGEVNG